MDNLLSLRDFAVSLARLGGDYALRAQEDIVAGRGQISTKASKLDMVTEADMAVEDLITAKIRETFPDHGIYGEERGKSNTESPYCWCLDPIDGTASYIHNQQTFTCSVGLYYHGQEIVGAVYAPALREMFYASQGGGSWCNGRLLHCTDHALLENSMLATGFSCVRQGWKRPNNLDYFCRLTPLVRGVRRLGSAALDCCYLALGRTDAYWELNLQPYDCAAGVVIVREAGGMVTDLRGGQDYPYQGILATNGALHETMLGFFQGYSHPEQ